VLQISRYVRKPFIVEAVQVSEENMYEVADWCKGEIKQAPDGSRYIKVGVTHPLNERQTMAFVNNWVLMAETGYKVFTNKPFVNSYEEFNEHRCGNTSTTADGKPCVLGKGHLRWPVQTGCRSLQDYTVINPLSSIVRQVFVGPDEVNQNQLIFMDPNEEVMR